ncbi:hypothetical protein AZ78_3134 [Lysobacter capsici AZ78]|uniref:EamA domain-containing protein n=1 Tax=Lysobacter capsici AZ78 TaxID=1444315 RepID=A0A108UAK9_9GAMM|nr:hypothetical protein AZ78_3134 [Lysobacter capsici AZ78]
MLTLAAPFISSDFGPRPAGFVIAVRVVAALFTVFLIEFISIGKNWARITYLVLTVLALPAPFMAARQGISISNVEVASIAVQLLAHGVGLYLLFTVPGKSWFAPSAR